MKQKKQRKEDCPSKEWDTYNEIAFKIKIKNFNLLVNLFVHERLT